MSVDLFLIGKEASETSIANGYTSATKVEKIALIHSEVTELLECLRRNTKDYIEIDGKPEGPASEVADIIIRTCELAFILGLNVEQALVIKMRYNRKRQDVPTHGGDKYI